MLDQVKTALRVKTDAFDDEIQTLIDDCLEELEGLGVYRGGREYTPQIQSTIIFYCKWKFGNNPDAERWERIYHDKVTKLMCRSGYGLEE